MYCTIYSGVSVVLTKISTKVDESFYLEGKIRSHLSNQFHIRREWISLGGREGEGERVAAIICCVFVHECLL